jgi:hypothetical protein
MGDRPYSACNALSSQESYEGSVCTVYLYFNRTKKSILSDLILSFKIRCSNIFCTTFSLLRWLIIGVNSVLVLLRRVVVGDIADVSEVHTSPIFNVDTENGSSMSQGRWLTQTQNKRKQTYIY